MRSFQMPAAERAEAQTPARRPARPSPLAFPAAKGYKVSTDTSPPVKAVVRPASREQAQVAGSKYDLDFIVATPAPLPGIFGDTILLCSRDNVSLARLDSGLLCLAVDHNPEALVGVVKAVTFKSGRVHGAANYLDGALATRIRSEIDQGARRGISPGFLVFDYEISRDDDAFIITKWEPYEISSTSIPRNPNAVILDLGRQPMSLQEATAPDIVTTSDPAGLSLSLGRRALADGKGSDKQRKRLSAFFDEFDAAVGRGLSRDLAVEAAQSRLA